MSHRYGCVRTDEIGGKGWILCKLLKVREKLGYLMFMVTESNCMRFVGHVWLMVILGYWLFHWSTFVPCPWLHRRYRGRNKRFAFNTLLRGDTPIRAHLRSRSTHFDEQVAGQGDSGVGGAGRENRSVLESDSEWDDSDALLLKAANGTSNDDLPSSSETVEEDSLYEKFMARQQENQWLQMFTSAGERARAHCQSRSSDSSDPDDDLSTSSDCLTANIRLSHVSLDKNQDMDIETGMMMSNNKPNILFQQLNPIEMDIYQRRINFMKTHGTYFSWKLFLAYVEI